MGEEGVQNEGLYHYPSYDLVDEVSEEERDGNYGVGLEDVTEHLCGDNGVEFEDAAGVAEGLVSDTICTHLITGDERY